MTTIVGLVLYSIAIYNEKQKTKLQSKVNLERIQVLELAIKAQREELVLLRGEVRQNEICEKCCNRGLKLLQQQKFAEAAACFQIVWDSKPNSVVVLDKLIDCYESTGHIKKIRELKSQRQVIIGSESQQTKLLGAVIGTPD